MSARVTFVRRALAATAAALAVSAAVVGAPAAPARVASAVNGDGERADTFVARTVDALQLAAWIREGARELRVLDLRERAAYETSHVPSAEAADFARLDTLASRPNATVVVYSDDDVRDAQASANLAARGHAHTYVLSGGMDAWVDEVMAPVLRGDSASYVAALSRYFGGAPRASDARGNEVAPPRANDPRDYQVTPPRAKIARDDGATPPRANDARGQGPRPGASAAGELGETPRRGC